jgi:hypothetical protein
MQAAFRPRIALASVAALLAVTAVCAHAAGDNVATLTKLSATPKRFCVGKSDRCPHPGTTIKFTLSTPAKVYGDIRPRRVALSSYTEFARKFPAGRNTVRITDRRLDDNKRVSPGRWTLKLQSVNSVGASGPTSIDVYVLKPKAP